MRPAATFKVSGLIGEGTTLTGYGHGWHCEWAAQEGNGNGEHCKWAAQRGRASPLTLQDIGDGLQLHLSTLLLQALLWLMSLIIMCIGELAGNEMT